MADTNINVDFEYTPGEAGKTAYVTVSDDKLIEMGYIPELGKEKQGLIVYNLNAAPIILEGDIALGAVEIKDGDLDIRMTVADLTNSNAQATMIVDANGDQITAFGTINDGVNGAIKATVIPLTNANPLATVLVDSNGATLSTLGGQIAEQTTPDPVLDGDIVNPWFDVFGRQIIAGYNTSLNAIDINTVNNPILSRMGPVTNLNGVTGTGAGASIDVSNYHNFNIHVVSSAITLGGTVTIEHSFNGLDEWAEIGSFTIIADETNELSISNQAYRYLRTNVTARSDGTFSTYIYAGN